MRVADEEAPQGAQPDEVSGGRGRWRVVVGVLVAVVLIAVAGVIGVAVGRSTAPGPDIVVQPEPVVEQAPAAEPMPVGVPSSSPSAAATPSSSASAPASAPAPAPVLAVDPHGPSTWSVVMTAAPGLDDVATTASGYRLVRAGISGPQVAAVLAGAFGLAGNPIPTEEGWEVGASGGSTLVVHDDPLVTWVIDNPAGVATPAAGEQLDPGRAIELATALLASIGVDTSSVDWQVDRYFGRTAVIAWQLVDGARTQLNWRLAFDPSGAVVQASGFSAGVEEVPGYPVVGAATAVTRAATVPWSALPPAALEGPSGASPSPSATASAAAADRPAIDIPVSEVVVDAAALSLAQYWQPDGSLLMLPAYTLSGQDGSRWSLVAVDSPYVSFVNQPYPLASPATG